jgi:cation diffusion facilitator CzcD-associated flavoprotein CzcO
VDGASQPELDVVIVGAGFSGIGMAIALLKEGRTSFVVLERADDLGGTWRDNTYPGCACDIPSHLYSYSFEPKPDWSRMYPPQPEIRAYLQAVAAKYGVTPFIRFGRTVTAMTWEAQGRFWRVTTSDGQALTARIVASGMGGLSNPAIPQLKGAERFAGAAFHSAKWDHAYDFKGKSVAVIGTGASAIQFTPQIARKAAKLHIFQRTPPWVVPKGDRPMRPWERRLFRLAPFSQTWLRRAIYCGLEIRAPAFGQPERLRMAQKLAKRFMDSVIKDPELRQKLTPDYVMGCKRILISNDYYPTLNRENVELVTEPIDEVRESGIVTADGRLREVDAIVYGTGFGAMDPLYRVEVRGEGGRRLAEDWEHGAQAYLGLTVAGYPNLFFLMGPNTGLGHNSMIYMIESQIQYVMDAIRLMERKGASAMEVKPQAQAVFNTDLQQRIAGSVWNAGGCKSWYLNAEGRNVSLWPGYTFTYRRRTRKVDEAAYDFAG